MGAHVIIVDNICKRYRLAPRARYHTLRDSLARWTTSPMNWLKKMSSSRAGVREDHFYALNEVSFEVKPGEVVGIIGRNGSGKSTLLKILSRITEPTSGEARVRGRIGSLLEVGTGFHPELTGRENIYLFGSILGMRRHEIDRKFDEIVDFADTETFLDVSVKRYSSGMYMRLAFAVAAHLDPEILFVDEVLAVGDAAFQKKCLGKMGDVTRQGRTVLFVSHNLGAVRDLCHRTLLLDGGRLRAVGETRNVIAQYLTSLHEESSLRNCFSGPMADQIQIESVQISDDEGNPDWMLAPSSPINLTIRGVSERKFHDLRLVLSVSRDGLRLFTLHDFPEGHFLAKGRFQADFRIPGSLLRPGEYTLGFGASRGSGNDYTWGSDIAQFQLAEEWSETVRERDAGVINVQSSASRKACA